MTADWSYRETFSDKCDDVNANSPERSTLVRLIAVLRLLRVTAVAAAW